MGVAGAFLEPCNQLGQLQQLSLKGHRNADGVEPFIGSCPHQLLLGRGNFNDDSGTLPPEQVRNDGGTQKVHGAGGAAEHHMSLQTLCLRTIPEFIAQAVGDLVHQSQAASDLGEAAQVFVPQRAQMSGSGRDQLQENAFMHNPLVNQGVHNFVDLEGITLPAGLGELVELREGFRVAV